VVGQTYEARVWGKSLGAILEVRPTIRVYSDATTEVDAARPAFEAVANAWAELRVRLTVKRAGQFKPQVDVASAPENACIIVDDWSLAQTL
jgi:hypothetical protein